MQVCGQLSGTSMKLETRPSAYMHGKTTSEGF